MTRPCGAIERAGETSRQLTTRFWHVIHTKVLLCAFSDKNYSNMRRRTISCVALRCRIWRKRSLRFAMNIHKTTRHVASHQWSSCNVDFYCFCCQNFEISMGLRLDIWVQFRPGSLAVRVYTHAAGVVFSSQWTADVVNPVECVGRFDHAEAGRWRNVIN